LGRKAVGKIEYKGGAERRKGKKGLRMHGGVGKHQMGKGGCGALFIFWYLDVEEKGKKNAKGEESRGKG